MLACLLHSYYVSSPHLPNRPQLVSHEFVLGTKRKLQLPGDFNRRPNKVSLSVYSVCVIVYTTLLGIEV